MVLVLVVVVGDTGSQTIVVHERPGKRNITCVRVGEA